MPLCPNCKTDQKKRSNGRCPQCKAEVDIYRGEWILAGDGSPAKQVYTLFFKLLSNRLSASSSRRVVIDLAPKTGAYKAEMKSAQNLLDLAGGDLSLALESIRQMFLSPHFKATTMVYAGRAFQIAMAQARAVLEEKAEKELIRKNTLQNVQSTMGMFDY